VGFGSGAVIPASRPSVGLLIGFSPQTATARGSSSQKIAAHVHTAGRCTNQGIMVTEIIYRPNVSNSRPSVSSRNRARGRQAPEILLVGLQ